ncbi:MAG: hypothetical protein RMJ43_16265 [Chloroherpetonaceae bacterium]|nr:hypothetical protein [Chthonomonadaceae bacterium]MDW8209388.1 hypothetical protein [Chloroherpetonaceae bacterium]
MSTQYIPWLALSAVLAGAASAGADGSRAASFRAKARVILHQWGPERARPQRIREHLEHLERNLVGVDGFFLYLDKSSFGVMSSTRLAPQTVREELRPVKDMPARRLRYHFALVYNDRPADLFDDWSVAIANWETFAAACREAGLVGIAFDNEEYFGSWANFPEDCKYPRTLDAYREQARERGAEVMAAIRRGFPEAVVVTLHGPTLSAYNGPPIVYHLPEANELWGPFFAGMLQARGTVLLCDGGELYALRSGEEFQTAYRWQKWGIASERARTPFIPASLRPEWPAVSVSWGIYDSTDEPTGREMNPDIYARTLAEALSRCDHFVWLYFEGHNLLGDTVTAWHRAIASGVDQGRRWRNRARRSLKAP